MLTVYLGKDATEAFEDVGHSDEARALLPDMLVGDFEQNSVRVTQAMQFNFSYLVYLDSRPSSNTLWLQRRLSPAQQRTERLRKDQGATSVSLVNLTAYVAYDSFMYFLPLAGLAAYFAWKTYTGA